ncbi:FAD-dependent oxidoreductase [Planktomarina sp.]|nr:FAD-dependent oxidoreductase [Planktomarina sp.]
MTNPKYEWIVVGGGINGIAIAEILCRNGHKVLLLEKNSKLASETTKEFHEWFHTGALYSLVPDKFATARYLLGAIDDLLRYYSGFVRMNLRVAANGLSIYGNGWFNDEYILYKYKNRKLNSAWMYSIAKSVCFIETLGSHDWLRRNAGGDELIGRIKMQSILQKMLSVYKENTEYFEVDSPDFTINSRKLLSDLLNMASIQGLEVQCNNKVEKVIELDQKVKVQTQNGEFEGENIVFCSPDLISYLFGENIKHGYAPMGIYEGVSDSQSSFVNLDFNTRNCINLLRKENGYGLAGGITLNDRKDVKDYFNFVHTEHLKLNPQMKLIETYIGIKKEIKNDRFSRNYLYHINRKSKRQWTALLGKFTLFSSLAPEFYRRVYLKNSKRAEELKKQTDMKKLVAPTNWAEITHSEEF